MMDRGLVVVGSGPAGLAAVRAFRKQDADTAVTMITADPVSPLRETTTDQGLRTGCD